MIAAISLKHPVRVGIDGVDCAGKTVLANELVGPLGIIGISIWVGPAAGVCLRQMRHAACMIPRLFG
jgi:hypothetical protein